MHQSIESTAPRPPGHSGGVKGIWPRKNVLLINPFPEGTGLVTILPICNAWLDREAMGPSTSLLRDKMEESLSVQEKVS